MESVRFVICVRLGVRWIVLQQQKERSKARVLPFEEQTVK